MPMRFRMILNLSTALASLWGCARDAPSAIPGALPADASEHTEVEAPDFDPELTLVWPGAPQVSRRCIDAGSIHETTVYRATYSETGPIIIFDVSVSLMSEKDLQDSDPQELVATQGIWDECDELDRKQIEFGPNKYLGCEMTGKVGDSFFRRLNVLAGRRLYVIEVASFKQERLAANDVVKFFESFGVKE